MSTRDILSNAVLVRNIIEKMPYKVKKKIAFKINGFGLAIKDIENGDKLIEIETEDNEELDTIDKLIKKVEDLNIPIYTDSYFVKKAEIELNKLLGR